MSMWYGCISCTKVFDSKSKLDKHYKLSPRCYSMLIKRARRSRRVRQEATPARLHQASKGDNSSMEIGEVQALSKSKPEEVYICRQCHILVRTTDAKRHQMMHKDLISTSACDSKDLNNLKAKYLQNCPSDEFTLPVADPAELGKQLKQRVEQFHNGSYQQISDLAYQLELIRIIEISVDEFTRTRPQNESSTNHTVPHKEHFSKVNYEAETIPWTFILPVIDPQEKENTISNRQFAFELSRTSPKWSPYLDQKSPATPLSSSSSHKENFSQEPGLAYRSGDTTTKLANESSVYVPNKQITSSLETASVAENGKAKIQKQQPKKLLCHLCYFCGMKFPGTDYLVHIMFTHLNPKTDAEVTKLKSYTEMLTTRLEIEAMTETKQSASTSGQLLTTPVEVEEPSHQYSKNAAETCPTRISENILPELKLQDIGNKILMACPLCPESTLPASKRISHMMSHIEEMSSDAYRCCPCCGLKLKGQRLSSFKEHISLHFRVKTFSCSYCWAGFSRQQTLQVHMRKMHDDLFQCRTPRKKRKFN